MSAIPEKKIFPTAGHGTFTRMDINKIHDPPGGTGDEEQSGNGRTVLKDEVWGACDPEGTGDVGPWNFRRSQMIDTVWTFGAGDDCSKVRRKKYEM